jgi:hypothetical protein
MNPTFLHKALKYGYEADNVGKLMSHWAYNSLIDSEIIADVFLVGIN